MASRRTAAEALNWRTELADFGRFVRAPRRMRGRCAEGAPWIRRLLLIAMLTLAVSLLIDTATQPLARWAGVQDELPDRITGRFMFAALIFAPISEELLFRAGLRQALYALAIGPALILLFVAPWVETTFLALAAWALLALLANRLLVWRRFARPGARFAFGRRFVRHFAWVFWAYALAFALVHIGNYGWRWPRGSIVPLMVLPQLLIGISLGYLRVRDALRSSMLLHFIVNSVGVALMVT